MHCKIVFNFALRHDFALLQDNAYWLEHLESHWPLGGVLIDLMITICEIYIMVANALRSKHIIHIK